MPSPNTYTSVTCCCHVNQVPFTLKDEDISEDWECKDNKWDRMYAACTMAQALTDEEIDGILAGQQDALEARPLPPVELETAETDNTEYALPPVLDSQLSCSLPAYLCWTIAGNTFRLGEPLLGSAGCILYSLIKYLFRSPCTSHTQRHMLLRVPLATICLNSPAHKLGPTQVSMQSLLPAWHLCCTSSSVPAVVYCQRPASRFQTGAGQAATRQRR